MKKTIRESEQLILGIFIGCLITIIAFITITSFITNDFKNVASPIITVIIFITTLRKFNLWLTQKNRDKAYEKIVKLTEASVKLELINRDIEMLYYMYDLFQDDSSKLTNDSTFKEFDSKLVELLVIFQRTRIEEEANLRMLTFWNVEVKNNEILPIDIQVELNKKLMELANFVQRTKTIDCYHSKRKKQVILEYQKLKRQADDKMKKFTEEKFDSVFTIK